MMNSFTFEKIVFKREPMPDQFNKHSTRLQFLTKLLVLFFIAMPVLAFACGTASAMENCSQSMLMDQNGELPGDCSTPTAMSQCDLNESMDQITKINLPKLEFEAVTVYLYSIAPLSTISPPRVVQVQHPLLSPVEIPLVSQKIILLV